MTAETTDKLQLITVENLGAGQVLIFFVFLAPIFGSCHLPCGKTFFRVLTFDLRGIYDV